MSKTTSITAKWLYSWVFKLSPLHGLLLDWQLDDKQHPTLSGLMLPIGPGLVTATAEAIADRPGLFPDAPGPDLGAAQQIAYAWLMLRDRLRTMAQLAADAYLATQAQLTGRVHSFVRTAMDPSQPAPIRKADVPRRNIVLVEAFLIVHGYYEGLNKKARNNARAAQAAAPATVTSAGDPAKPKSREQKRAEKTKADHEKAVRTEIFVEALRVLGGR